MVRWLALAALLPACEGLTPGADTEPGCELSLETLPGRTFVGVETPPGGGADRPNPIARVQFAEKDGKTVAKYTVASLSDVYELPCEVREKDDSRTLVCKEKARPTDWCQALLVADAVCTKKELRKLGAEAPTDEELNEAIKSAKENWRKFRGTENEKQFVFNNNNLANKLQGRLYVDVDDKRCRLSVGDYYWTIYNGRAIEDTNVVGQNPFVETQDPLLFEHCDEGNIMPGIESEQLPSDLSSIPGMGRQYESSKEYWYHYLGEKHVQAEQGCSYSFDLWANYKPAAKNVPVEVKDGKVQWKAKYAFADDDMVVPWGQPRPLGVITMVRHKECAGGAREKIDTVCEAGFLVK